MPGHNLTSENPSGSPPENRLFEKRPFENRRPLENRQFCEFWGENGVKCIQMGQTNFLGTIFEFWVPSQKMSNFKNSILRIPSSFIFGIETLKVAKKLIL